MLSYQSLMPAVAGTRRYENFGGASWWKNSSVIATTRTPLGFRLPPE